MYKNVMVFCASVALSCNALAFFHSGFKADSKDASGAVTGAAGVSGDTNAAPSLQRCDKPFGKIAVYEPQDTASKFLQQYRLPSPTGLIRLMVQQSNCFVVVERGQAMANIMQERALADGGQLRGGSNIGKGQMATADFVVTPEVVFSDGNAGGIGGAVGAIGSLFGPLGMIAGAIVGGMKFKQAQTTLLLADTRSGIQLATAQGSAEKTDWGIGGVLGGGGVIGGLGAYESTAEGKVVAAAFLSSYNNMIAALRDSPELNRNTTSLKTEAATVARAKSGNEIANGDVVQPKLAKISVYEKANKTSTVVNQLLRTAEAVADGREENGFIYVQGDGFEGWVEALLVRKI